jgi:hypothetical protein
MGDELVAQFISFTGANPDEAKSYLEMSGGDLQQAVNLFVDMGGGGGAAPGSPARPPPPAVPSGGGGVAPGGGPVVDEDVAAEVAAVAAAAGIDLPDATMADAEEPVRAPIAAFQDQIINPEHERRRVQESIQADATAMNKRMSFDRPVDVPGAGAGEDVQMKDAPAGQVINQLFAAPAYNESDPWSKVVEKAKAEVKWILVNIQQAEVFASHQLNRDVWSDETIKDIVTGSFLFWQRDDKSTEGVQFCQYHNCGHQLPHVCVIDPRTGRRVKSWDGKKWVESHDAAEYLFGFLDQFSMTKSPMQSPMASPEVKPSAEPAASGDMVMTGLDQAVDIDVEPEVEASEPVAIMPEEPAESAECAKVSFRLPSGQRIMRRFLKTAPISEMFAVASASAEAPVSRIDLTTQFPKRSLRDAEGGMDLLVKDAQVAGSQIMVIVRSA